MKSNFLKFLLLLLLATPASMLFGQDTAEGDSEYFVKTISISRIYTYRNGYRILYTNSRMDIGELYVPMTWFTEAGGPGEIITGRGSAFPYFSVFWKNGEFDHIRLYFNSDPNHMTWGRSQDQAQYQDSFENIDTVELVF